MVLPSFDVDNFPLIIIYSNDTFDIVNVRTGYREVLIRGNAKNDGRWPATFFIDRDDGRLEFHFCTVRLQDNSYL